MKVLDLADGLWTGSIDIKDHHPFSFVGELEEVAPDTGVRRRRSPTSRRSRTDDGLVLVDTGSVVRSPSTCTTTLRGWTRRRARHRGVLARPHRPRLRRRPSSRQRRRRTGWPAPQVVAHEAMPRAVRPLLADRRLQRRHQPAAVPARRTCAGRPSTATPTRPTATASTSTSAASRFELHHAAGETDDHTWTWVPDAQGAVHAATCSSGRRPTPATRRRCSATPSEWAAALRDDGGARRRGAAARPRPADRRRRPHPRRRSPTPPSSSSRCTTRRSR